MEDDPYWGNIFLGHPRPGGHDQDPFLKGLGGGMMQSHTPPRFTPGSYEISHMKRARAGSISGRLRSASDLEERGVIDRNQKGVLKDMIIAGDQALQAALDGYEAGDPAALVVLMESGALDRGDSLDLLQDLSLGGLSLGAYMPLDLEEEEEQSGSRRKESISHDYHRKDEGGEEGESLPASVASGSRFRSLSSAVWMTGRSVDEQAFLGDMNFEDTFEGDYTGAEGGDNNHNGGDAMVGSLGSVQGGSSSRMNEKDRRKGLPPACAVGPMLAARGVMAGLSQSVSSAISVSVKPEEQLQEPRQDSAYSPQFQFSFTDDLTMDMLKDELRELDIIPGPLEIVKPEPTPIVNVPKKSQASISTDARMSTRAAKSKYVPKDDVSGGPVGAYSPQSRKERIERFLEKRKHRVWTKTVKYDVRKNFADTRMRVKGRFVKKEDEALLRELMAIC